MGRTGPLAIYDFVKIVGYSDICRAQFHSLCRPHLLKLSCRRGPVRRCASILPPGPGEKCGLSSTNRRVIVSLVGYFTIRTAIPGRLAPEALDPFISGLGIPVKLREHPQTKTLPVLVLSARSELKDVYQCLSLGADGYVTKPTKAGPLLQAVKAILGA